MSFRPSEENTLVSVSPPPAFDHHGSLPSQSHPLADDAEPKISVGKQPGYFDSALEDVESVSSVDLSALSMSAPSERIRRRSVLESRHRPPAQAQGGLRTPEAIELPELSPVSEYPGAINIPLTNRGSTSLHPELESASRWSTREDLEVASVQTPAGSVLSAGLADVGASHVPLVSATQRVKQKRRGTLHLAALYWCLFLEGWNDGSTGPMLPTIQKYYNVGFAIVSLLFVVNCIGFISGAMCNVYLNDRFGFGKVLVIGACLQLSAYVMLSTGGPFPVMCIAFGLIGFSLSLQNAQANGFIGSLKEHTTTKMSLLHASDGSQDETLAKEGQAAGEADNASQNKYRQILNLRIIHFLSIFALIYVGVEVTLGGWIVTFIQQKRGGGASAGYISAGFFGGIMLGRVGLMWLTKLIGNRRVMFLYAFLAIQLEVTIWVVPSLFENAIAIACIGVLLGPMYPILMNYCTDVLPKWLLTGSVGWIAGVGQAGSAVLPFVTGLLASKFGIGSLQPLIVSMMSTMIVIWAFVPRVRRVD
ncbi:hypothetical protein EIP91_008977 [Steccherinum ochraceum]|uniref:Major facilitator superfamily (MFS) profile domain-containing protein n=1 Tax=Steccherinum ochraceum TaxID=92696 RepID=A0A4R0RTV0_9APHY|nr:hypothetical protein EIP91_008977 [Steccherinum ochraceum]